MEKVIRNILFILEPFLIPKIRYDFCFIIHKHNQIPYNPY